MGCAASKPPDILSSASVHPLKTRDSEARKTLGEGPKRFALIGERSIEEQIEALDLNERECFDTLKKKWEEKYPDAPFTDEMYLRFARCSPGAKKFSKKSSFKAMKKFDKRYLSLTAAGMKRQLMTKVSTGAIILAMLSICFPLPMPTADTLFFKPADTLSCPWFQDA